MSKKKDEQGHLHRKNYPHAVHIAVAAVTLGMTMGIGVNEVLADQRKNTLLDDARLTTPTVERPGTEFPKVERPEAEFPKVERPGVKFPTSE
jgi:hypothetical protein